MRYGITFGPSMQALAPMRNGLVRPLEGRLVTYQETGKRERVGHVLRAVGLKSLTIRIHGGNERPNQDITLGYDDLSWRLCYPC